MSKYNVKFCFFPNLKNNFIKIQKQYGGASLLTKIGQSFNQEHIKNMKTKLSNYQKNSLNVLSKSNESNIFKNFIDIFKNTK